MWFSFKSFYKICWSVCLWDLWLDFIVPCYPFHQFKSIFAVECSDFQLVDIKCFSRGSDWLTEFVHVEVSLNINYEASVVWVHFFATWFKAWFTEVGEFFRPKNEWYVSATFHLFSRSSRQKSYRHRQCFFGTSFSRKIASISANKALWCSRKRKLFSITFCSRSDSDTSLSLRATLWFCTAALYSHLTFSGLWGWWQDDVVNNLVKCLSFHSGLNVFSVDIFVIGFLIALL